MFAKEFGHPWVMDQVHVLHSHEEEFDQEFAASMQNNTDNVVSGSELSSWPATTALLEGKKSNVGGEVEPVGLSHADLQKQLNEVEKRIHGDISKGISQILITMQEYWVHDVYGRF